jgi:peptide/nickel transport system substrate-binding protein
MSKRISRRTFLKATAAPLGVAAANALLPPYVSQAMSIPGGQFIAPTAFQGIKEVARNRTLIHAGVGGEAPNQFTDAQNVNPFLIGTTRGGWQFSYEPMFFYNVYGSKDNETAWVGESYTYNASFNEVTIKIRKGVAWSDGTPYTAKDIVFTMNMLKENVPDLIGSGAVKQWVKDVVAEDDLTAKFILTDSNPHFMYDFFIFHFDIGIPIMPEHIWKGQDPKTFTNFDLSKGWPVVTGPYTLVLSSPEQKIWDRRDDWWAAKTGFHALPAPERIIYIPGNDETKLVQLMLTNEADSTLTLTSRNIKAILDQNPKIDTWSGKEPPYGYTDWWPLGLGFNDMEPPFNDAEIRWAINRAIDRNQLNEIGYGGAGVPSIFPWPGFASMKKYEDNIKDLVDKYQIDKPDTAETDAIMTKKGWAKDGEGMWTKDGQRFPIVVETFNVFQDVTPVLVEQLRRAGFDSSFKMTADFFTRLPLGQVAATTFGHGGGTRDPFATLELYHSKNAAPTGKQANQFYRWINKDYDALIDQMGKLSADDPKFLDLFHQAMEIWIKELPDIPLAEFFHRNPRNNTYWTNWPSKDNPYINDANWHRTFELVLINLKPVS